MRREQRRKKMGSALCNASPAYRSHLWCPYCDRVVEFQFYEYYEDVMCLACKRSFPPHTWPKGFDIKTGELKKEKEVDEQIKKL
jgi:hypothetical protein